jgi:hypothetical protein
MCLNHWLPSGELLGPTCRATLLHPIDGRSYRHQMVLALNIRHRLGHIAATLDDDWLDSLSGDQIVAMYLWLFGPNDVPAFFRPFVTSLQPAAA